MNINHLIEGKITFDAYCEELKLFLQNSNEINIRLLVSHWEDYVDDNLKIMSDLFDFVTQYSSNLVEENNQMRDHMRDKISEFYHPSEIEGVSDISIFEPLERQINGLPIFEEDTLVSRVFYSAVRVRHHTRKMYSYLSYYVDKITTKMQHLKSQILTLELSRYRSPQIALQPIDCVIQFYMDEYVKMSRIFAHYHGKMCAIHVDSEFLCYRRVALPDVYSILYKYYDLIFDKQYGLPKSVIDEARKNPQVKHLVKYSNFA